VVRRSIVWSVLAMSVAPGCVGGPDGYARMSSTEIARDVRVIDSEFDRALGLQAPVIDEWAPFGGKRYKLLATVRKEDGSETIQLKFLWRYRRIGVARIVTASFSEGEPKPVQVVERLRVDCVEGECEHTEIVTVDLARAFVERHAGDGFRVRFDTRGGQHTVATLPASYVEAFLVRLDSLRGNRGPARAGGGHQSVSVQ
jgi:hypothetical protein